MKFSQAFLLLALGFIVSLPQEVKSDPSALLGGLLGGGAGGLLGGGAGGLLGGAGGLLGGGGGLLGGGGGLLGGGGIHAGGAWSSSGGSVSGGFIGSGGASAGGAAAGGAAAGGAAAGGGAAGPRVPGVLGELPESKGSANIMYPYGPSEGDQETPNIDDGAAEVPLANEFIFFNKKYRSLFVNNNGVVSFGVQVSKYTPDGFPLTDGSAFVAPYWGDVNTVVGGKVYFRESTKPNLLQRVSDDINRYFPNINYKGRWLFVATWDKVAYYGSSSNRVNTFQAVLTTDGKRAYIMLNYASIQWTTGVASKGNAITGLGGIPAQAGFNSGDETHYFNIPASRTNDIVYIASTSNINVPGRWVFRVDNFSVPGGCVAGVNFAKYGDIFWEDDACERKCTCQPDGETTCTPNECTISEVCQPNKWFFLCQAPESCI